MSVMMKCGHASNATTQDGDPICAICILLTDDALIATEDAPDLSGRTARCGYYGTVPAGRNRGWCSDGGKNACMCEKPSDAKGLAFFRHKPKEEYDEFYCGCWGWD